LWALAISPAAKDVRIGRVEVLVDDDTVVDLETGCCGELRAGDGPDANDDHVCVNPGPVVQHDTGRGPATPGHFDCRGPVAQFHAMAAV
jgi:hypothetical protein